MTFKKNAAFFSLITASALLFGGCSLFGGNAKSAVLDYDFSEMELIQLQEPEEGRMAAVIKTSMGDITAVLYPEYAPKAVQNFVNRANYEKLFVATGSSNDGATGATDDGKLIENEYSPKLWPFKGALCAYSLSTGYFDSRYFFCNTYDEFTEEQIADLRGIKRDGEQLFHDELVDASVEHGSLPNLSGFYTVFGQIAEGMDVL